MKKAIALIGAVIILSFAAEHSYTFTEGQALMLYDNLQVAKEVLPNSDLPAKVVTVRVRQIDSLQGFIAAQYRHFYDTTKPKK